MLIIIWAIVIFNNNIFYNNKKNNCIKPSDKLNYVIVFVNLKEQSVITVILVTI